MAQHTSLHQKTPSDRVVSVIGGVVFSVSALLSSAGADHGEQMRGDGGEGKERQFEIIRMLTAHARNTHWMQ